LFSAKDKKVENNLTMIQKLKKKNISNLSKYNNLHFRDITHTILFATSDPPSIVNLCLPTLTQFRGSVSYQLVKNKTIGCFFSLS